MNLQKIKCKLGFHTPIGMKIITSISTRKELVQTKKVCIHCGDTFDSKIEPARNHPIHEIQAQYIREYTAMAAELGKKYDEKAAELNQSLKEDE